MFDDLKKGDCIHGPPDPRGIQSLQVFPENGMASLGCTFGSFRVQLQPEGFEAVLAGEI
jgi:hypothetical protein